MSVPKQMVSDQIFPEKKIIIEISICKRRLRELELMKGK